MASHEERRRAGIRLTVLQYVITGRVLRAGRELLGAAGRAARQVRGDGREQQSADAGAARAARRRVRSRRPRAGREPPLLQHLDRPRAHQGSEPHDPAAGQRARARRSGVREIVDRHRREPTYRPITIIQDATLAQVAAVTARRLDFELPDVVVEQVPTRRYPDAMAAHLFGYVGEVNDAQVADDDGSRAATSSASRASRRSTTAC